MWKNPGHTDNCCFNSQNLGVVFFFLFWFAFLFCKTKDAGYVAGEVWFFKALLSQLVTKTTLVVHDPSRQVGAKQVRL